MKSQIQKELVLNELKMVKEVAETKQKEGLKHHQEIITKVDAKIDFRNMEIKVFRNELLNMYEKLKGMKEVLHQREKELNTQWAAMENACENHHKDQKLLVEKKI